MAYPNPNVPGFVPDDDAEYAITDRELTPEIRAHLDRIANNYLTRYMRQCWIENDADGFTGWRWDKYNVHRRIAGVANRYGGIIVMGTRHLSNLMVVGLDALISNKQLIEWAGEDNHEQGFVDQYGTFLDREEAWILADASDQIKYRKDLPAGTLYSEHLW